MKGKLKSPLKWYGGKTKLVKKLLPLIPQHKTYVEVFAGSAALFFAKQVSPLEVINDLHSGLVNLYRVLRDPQMFQKFEHLVNLTPYSREEFSFCKQTWRNCPDEVEKAYRWFVVIRQSFGAVGRSFGVSVTQGRNGMSSGVSGYLAAIQRLPEIHQRLRGVQVENNDFRTLIPKYDRRGTFFYLDPPYVLSTRKGKVYDYEMSNQDHEELVEVLLGIKGKAFLSGYANPIYTRLEREGWKRHDFKANCAIAARTVHTGFMGKGSATESQARIESVWVSP